MHDNSGLPSTSQGIENRYQENEDVAASCIFEFTIVSNQTSDRIKYLYNEAVL